jgi:hypothetical protein
MAVVIGLSAVAFGAVSLSSQEDRVGQILALRVSAGCDGGE